MKNIFLLIVATVLLVTLGFGQTPAPSSNTDQASIKGCLSGSDGNYTVAEDGTTQTYKIASSAVDLKPHVGHDIEVTGEKTTATSSGLSDNSVAVTGVNMISDHCATPTASTTTGVDTTNAAAASTPAVVDTTTTTTTTASTPVVADPAPVATASTPVAADPTPPQTASAPMTKTASAPDNTEQLPNTATSLPLLGLLGLGLVGLGLLSRRSRTNQR
ncbi:MAG: LPXTG cell wall anchor domain-containing protein [Terriglobales bacterium]